MPTGKMKFFNTEKGYGFLAVDGSRDMFIHARDIAASGIQGSLKEGENVSFEIAEGKKGPFAINIARV